MTRLGWYEAMRTLAENPREAAAAAAGCEHGRLVAVMAWALSKANAEFRNDLKEVGPEEAARRLAFAVEDWCFLVEVGDEEVPGVPEPYEAARKAPELFADWLHQLAVEASGLVVWCPDDLTVEEGLPVGPAAVRTWAEEWGPGRD